MASSKLDQFVARSLRKAGYAFEREAALGGAEVDFLITEGDHKVVIETKSTKPHAQLKQTREQLRGYVEHLGADKAFMVVGDVERSSPKTGVVRPRDIVAVVQRAVGPATKKQRKKKPQKSVHREVFAAMPFASEFEDVFFVAMAPAAASIDAKCVRLDREDYVGDVVREIKRRIRRSVAVIADLSRANANVLYEVGYAHAITRPAIHICRDDAADLPFDVSTWNTMTYASGRTHLLRRKLTKRLKAIVDSGGR